MVKSCSTELIKALGIRKMTKSISLYKDKIHNQQNLFKSLLPVEHFLLYVIQQNRKLTMTVGIFPRITEINYNVQCGKYLPFDVL